METFKFHGTYSYGKKCHHYGEIYVFSNDFFIGKAMESDMNFMVLGEKKENSLSLVKSPSPKNKNLKPSCYTFERQTQATPHEDPSSPEVISYKGTFTIHDNVEFLFNKLIYENIEGLLKSIRAERSEADNIFCDSIHENAVSFMTKAYGIHVGCKQESESPLKGRITLERML